jgi:virginiamycin B lyase
MKLAFVAFAAALTACAPAATRGDASPTIRSTATAVAVPTAAATVAPLPPGTSPRPLQFAMQEFTLPRGQGPHDVAPARDGGVWYTAQLSGELGWLDPKTGTTKAIKLGTGSAPHGVIVGPDGAPWITDGGLNSIVRVDPATSEVKRYPLPANKPNANLNTAVFDRDGTLWFTGQSGVFGRLDPKTGAMVVSDAPRGPGPYGIAACPDGEVYFASLAGSYVGRIVKETGGAIVLTPPTGGQGARRVWCDSKSQVWVAEWNVGQLGVYEPATQKWREWKLSGPRPMVYAVFVDDADTVWLADWGANAIAHFDPVTEAWAIQSHPQSSANIRQLLGRPGEVWGAMSGQDKLVVARSS